jgi:multidrug efflux pump subunit AcrA (membrane-fusion protein)
MIKTPREAAFRLRKTRILSYLRFLLLLLPLLGAVGCARGEPNADDLYADSAANMAAVVGDEATPTPIPAAPAVARPTYRVQRGDVTKKLIISGHIAPLRQTDLYFKTSGRIKSVSVKSGDMVKAGQLIAELEMTDLERDLAGSNLELQHTQAKLKSAQNELARGAKQAQINLEIARENLAIVQTQNPAPRKAKAEAELQQASLARQRAKKGYDALPAGAEKDASPEATALQQANLNYTVAKAAYDLVMQEVTAFGHRVAIAERQIDLAQLLVDSLTGEADPLLVIDVERAQFAVDKIQAGLADARIVAPFNGEVQVAFALSPGSAADAYRYLATVSDITSLEVAGDVANVPLDQVSAGMAATVSPVAQPGVDFEAHIRQVPPRGLLAETNQEKTLRVTLDDPAKMSMVRNGDLVRIALVMEEKSGVLWLPPQAVRTFEGRKFVVVQDDTGQRRIDVKLGIETEAKVEIIAGLTEGQTVMAP